MTTPILNKELDYFSYLNKQSEEEKINQPITLESSKPSEIPSDLNYLNYIKPQEKDISFSREFAYGAAQEPTAIGGAYRITKAAIQSAFDRGETYKTARKRIEDARQEKILEDFPQFRDKP